MADYISAFSGTEIDAAVNKAKGITKTAPEINTILDHSETVKNNLDSMEDGEIPVKKSDGTLTESGIIDNGKNIFFPKTGRFPSGSIDVGPATTISESGGWLQYLAQTLGKQYLLLDYEITKAGTTKPIYWERKAEETDVVIQSDKSKNMNINTFDHVPTTDSQVNKIYFDFSDAASDLLIEIVSLDTNEPIKYIPDEAAWQNFQKGKPYTGLNIQSGVNEILGETPFSALQAYHLRFNFNKFVNIKGSGSKPYIKVDRQLIVKKNVLVDGDGGGSGGGVDEFTELIDTPDVYTGKGGKYVAVKSGEDGLEFVDGPTDGHSENEKFSKAFGVEATNKSGGTVNAGSFVFIAPDKDLGYGFIPITKTTGYKGELFGYLRNNVNNGEKGFVELITVIQTGETGTNVGDPAFIGFDVDTDFANIQIAEKNVNAIDFGRCGVFGEKNSVGEAVAIFNAFQVEAENLIDVHADEYIDYHSSIPAVIDKKAKFVYLVATLQGGGGTVIQPLPALKDVQKGTQIVIENLSLSELDDIQLQAATGDKIEGNPDYSVKGGNHKVILVATDNKWSKIYDSISATKNEITFGRLYGDYASYSINEVELHSSLVMTKDADNPTIQLAVSPNIVSADPTFTSLQDEVKRLKTDISEDGLGVFTYRSKSMPTFEDKKYKAYYISLYKLNADTNNINMPNPTDPLVDGTTFSIDNNDASKAVTVTPKSGETINGKTTYTVGASNMIFLVKNGTNWVVAFSGFVPGSLNKLIDAIKLKLSGSLNTIPEIEAQLKDRLHTFREIQSEFSDQLHTDDAIEKLMTDKGFSKGASVGYGLLDSNTDVPLQGWVVAYISPNSEVLIPSSGNEQKYVAVIMPDFLTPLVNKLKINGMEESFNVVDVIQNENYFKALISNKKYDTSQAIRLSIEYTEGINFEDASILYGFSDTDTQPSDLGWKEGYMSPNQEVMLPIPSPTSKFLFVAIPNDISPGVEDIELNDNVIETTESEFHINSHRYKLYKTSSKQNFSSKVKLSIKYDEQISPGGLEIDDGVNNAASIQKINAVNMELSNIVPSTGEVTLTSKGITGRDDDNKEFPVTKIQSLDGKIRVSNLGSGVMDLDADYNTVTDGIFAKLGNDEDINTDFHDQRPYFSDIYDNSGKYVGIDFNDKAFTIQEGDNLDPNVTGGSTFNIGMYFETLDYNVASDDGYVELKVVELSLADGSVVGYLNDIDGNPVGIRREYKSGDEIGRELLLGVVRAKGQKKIAFEIDVQFGEQILRASSNTCVYIQEVDKEHNSGLCELLFQRHTGYTINKTHRYYGINNMNLAAALVKDQAEIELNDTNELMGNGVFFDTRGKCMVSIQDNHIIMKDNGTDLPVFYLGKIWDETDTYELRLKNLNAKVVITDKNNAFAYALMKWSGTSSATLPIITGYNNAQQVLAQGWSFVGSPKFIPEDVVAGDHTDTNAFTVPDDAKQIAMIIYPIKSSIPTTMKLKDFEVDVSPAFTKTIIQSTSHITEEHLKYDKWMYKAVVNTPAGDSGYRFTVNNTDTKLPVGIVKGGDGKVVNDNAWTDPGAYDPNKVQGDLKFLADGQVTIDYTARCFNEQGTVNQLQFWLAKLNGDGSFTEVANSRYASTIEANRKVPKFVNSQQFTFDVKKNESYRFFAKSDKADGFFVQSNNDGRAMIEFIIDFNEIEEYEQDLIDRITDLETHANEITFVKAGVPVSNPEDYRMEIDVDTGRTTIKTL